MKKIFFLAALLSASMLSFAQETNFALASNGSSATASSGTADAAIDGNSGTRWESAQTDDETWTLNLGQARTFNQIRILWEGAYCTHFTISYSTDGENYTLWHNETELAAPGWQKIYKETPVTAQYIQYHGTQRATGYGQSFYEFEVYYLAEAPKEYVQLTGLAIVASSQGENDVNRVLDGNAGTEWQGRPAGVSGGDEASRTFDAWFVVDLGGFYTVDKVDIHFEGACAQDYHIDFSLDNTNWLLGHNYVGKAGINGRTDEVTDLDNNQKVRYVRFWSTKAGTEWGMKIFEFRVYGQEWVDSGDTEAPVMSSAALESVAWNSAVIAVAATDNGEVVKYHVVDAMNNIDVRCTPTDGKITVSGLSAETSYNFTVTAVDAANNESAAGIVVNATTSAHAVAPSAAAAAPTWPAAQVKAIYSATYNANCNFQDWGSGTAYTQEDYGKKLVLSNGGYFGLDGFALNCLSMEKLHVDIWIADDAALRLVPIYGGAGLATDDTHGKMVNLTGGQWNSIDLTLATDFAGLNLASIYQFKIDNAANLTFWMDNLYFYREAAVEDTEVPTNVTASEATQGYFSVVLAVSAEDNMGVVNYSVMNGEEEVATGAGASGATVNITVAGLQANAEYNFSVVAKDDAGNAAEAVAVTAHTLVAPAPAEAPTYAADKVIAIQTDVYTNIAYGIQGWYAEPAVSTGLLGASSVAFCLVPNITPSSCFGFAFAATDISKYDALEMDVYATAEGAVLDIQVIGVGAASTPFNLTAGQWNHIVLDIHDNGKTNCEQIGFYNCNNLIGTCFIQNVLFVDNAPGTGIDQIDAASKAVKMIENGQLVIIKNGVRYNVAGQVIR